jgi:GTP pyrophosphokinase
MPDQLVGSGIITSVGKEETVAVLGLKGLLTSMARCCNPLPGDEIIGYVTRGRGATIHRKDCPNILSAERDRLVRVSWGEERTTYPIPVRIRAYDRDGLMRDVATLIANEGVNMPSVKAETDGHNMAIFDLILEVRDIVQLARILDRLEALPNILEAQRYRPG